MMSIIHYTCFTRPLLFTVYHRKPTTASDRTDKPRKPFRWKGLRASTVIPLLLSQRQKESINIRQQLNMLHHYHITSHRKTGKQLQLICFHQSQLQNMSLVKSNNADKVIPALAEIYKNYGNPENQLSENGPPFNQ